MKESPKPPRRIVFICTGNCIRSQMAEGLLRHLAGNRFWIGSAGVMPAGYVHEHAIEVMDEIGIDISQQESKGLDELALPQGTLPDVLVTLCDYAVELVPNSTGRVQHLHWPLDDPIMARGSPEERLEVFRLAREKIRARLEQALADGELERPPR